MAWNRPELRERLARVNAEWRAVLDRSVRARCASELGHRAAARGARLARDDVQRGSCSSGSSGIDAGHASSSTGSTAGSNAGCDDIALRRRRASRLARAIPTSRATSSATACSIYYEVLRRRRADGPAAADVVDRPLAPLEDADPVPRAALPRGHVRRSRQRPVGPAAGPDAYARGGVRRRRARRDGRDRHRARGARRRCRAGAQRSLLLAASHPERVAGLGLHRARPCRCRRRTPRAEATRSSTSGATTYDGWEKYNRHYWLEDYEDFLEFFFSQIFTEPHSTKPREDCVGWGLETTPETLIATQLAPRARRTRQSVRDLAARIDCPVLVIHGDRRRDPPARLAAPRSPRRPAATLVTLEGSGHGPHARDPVKVNLLLRDFVDDRRAAAAQLGPRQVAGRKRALYISSPIGLGHARRDVGDRRRAAQAASRPRDRLARAAPGDRGARGARRADPPGERATWPTSRGTSRASRPSTTCTASRRSRRMDEILLANFMVFHDVVREEPYDLWIGDEAWELDYYLHENPEQKRAAVRLADRLRRLAADARRRRARGVPDRRLQRGDDRAHRALPARARPRDLRRRPRRHRARRVRSRPARDPRLDRASTTTSPATSPASTRRVRRPRRRCAPSSATATDEQVCIVTVGGSGVGGAPAAAGDRRRTRRRKRAGAGRCA